MRHAHYVATRPFDYHQIVAELRRRMNVGLAYDEMLGDIETWESHRRNSTTVHARALVVRATVMELLRHAVDR